MSFRFEDGAERPVIAEKHDGVNNCYQFTIQHEDHTLGNMLTQRLLDEDRVLFAGYRIHHPMDDLIYIRVHVADQSVTRPAEVVQQTIQVMASELTDLHARFFQDVKKRLEQHE
jgi:DNA-directed RNA polymerase II subunit RPB11